MAKSFGERIRAENIARHNRESARRATDGERFQAACTQLGIHPDDGVSHHGPNIEHVTMTLDTFVALAERIATLTRKPGA